MAGDPMLCGLTQIAKFGIDLPPMFVPPVMLVRQARGQKRWTLQMLADKLVELEVVESISRETVRTTLKKTNSSLG